MATFDCLTADSISVAADSVAYSADDNCCPDVGSLVEIEVNRVATQYREATKFLGLIRALLGETEGAARNICAIPEFFDLDTATGDQLTIIGKWLGFPRCHCVCDAPQVFGFSCSGSYTGPYDIAGFCAAGSTWSACEPLGSSELCISDDETYRGMLRARRYQMLGLFDIASLQSAARSIWGDAASVVSSRVGEVVMSPGRVLTAFETASVPIVFRVLPIAPGITGSIHYGTGPIFGFGEGWGGFCEDAAFLCPADPNTYTCA